MGSEGGRGTQIIGVACTKNTNGLRVESGGSANVCESSFDENNSVLCATKTTFNKNGARGAFASGFNATLSLVDIDARMNGLDGIGSGDSSATVNLRNVRACDNDQAGFSVGDVCVTSPVTDDVFNAVTCDSSDPATDSNGDIICVCGC